ncbi:long-chain-fatty-acid--CoA ligase [Nocardioides marmotae]|uniref:long-chain-fatty-acid--CoA ligase n=1 Tax=Nocardioides marmotae TaxID=2663857 RepID=UPI0012B642FF|nr:long-chain-fatty-acid--CoA ligase [Nocardioides marmotae]MBC9734302.1 long-chain-fatty-acid--CoA ligase [Nocardioides marmotae]MTB85403.1 long-chain-fatty-acid--CoA ligase [Nocardioides marmotae]
MSPAIHGHPSTHGDHYQLNTTNLFRQAVVTHPEQEIHHRPASGEWRTTTYAATWERVARTAHALESLGVGAGDVVGILDWNSLRHFELYWAIPGLGAVMLQMNLRLAPEDLAYVVEHSGASVVCVDESLLPQAEELARRCPQVRRWVVMADRPVAEIDTTLPEPVDHEALLADGATTYAWPVIEETSAYSACYTTGTTGRPKGVFYSHRGIVLHTMMWAADQAVGDRDCVLLTTPMFHAQCWGLPQVGVYARSRIVLPGRYTAEEIHVLADAMVRFDVTVTNGAPAIFAPMLEHLRTLEEPPDLSRARMISGSTEPPLSLMRGFHELTGARVIHGYGATETTPLITSNRVKPSLDDVLTEDEKWDIQRSQGLPVAGVDIRLLGPEGTFLPHDGTAVGEVCVRGPWVTESYWRVEDDGEKFHRGYWRSGDLGTISPEGYLKITDRLKDVIKSGGEWISSIDLENALVAHPHVREAAVVGAPHPRWQERPVALVVAEDGASVDLDDVREHLAGRFARWQVPDEILVVSQLPRTGVGKIDKKVLRAECADVYAG